MFIKLLKHAFVACACVYTLNAQETQNISLQACIEIALTHNLDLKAAGLRAETETIQFKQSRNALLPSINANYNLGLSNGRSIDPFTNSYVNEELTYSNAGLSINTTIFDGFRILNTLKQNSLNKAAAEMEIEEARQNLVLDVTLSFLQVLNFRELVKLAETRLITSKEQLNRLHKLQEEETGDPVAYHDLQGQVALDQTAVNDAKNSLNNALADLKFLLNTERPIEASQLVLLLDLEPRSDTADAVYEAALHNLAAIKAKELREEAAAKGVAVARAQYAPQISLFANFGTNYSSAARLFEDAGTQTVQTGDFVSIAGIDYAVFTQEGLFEASPISYTDQFNNNLNSAAGVSVSIPIFNGFQAKNAVQLQKVNRDQASVILEQTKRALKQNITRAYNDLDAAYSNYQFLEAQVEAYEESFRINEVKFNLGVSTSVAYITSKNNLDNARINLTNARYAYLLTSRILDYYSGRIAM